MSSRAPSLVPLGSFVAMLAFAIVALGGCGAGNVIAKTPSIAEVDDQQSTCKVAKDPLNPLIVEWPASSKVNLDSASQRGLVVVSYAGCTLKILNHCSVKGAYEYTGVTPARDKLDITSEDELYARLPLGAVSLKGELEESSGLRLDYIAVGQRVADGAPKELEGDCEGATHYVRTITLGAYSLDAMAAAEAGGGVDFHGAGAGGGRKERDQRLRGAGDVDKCAGSSPRDEYTALEAGCGAPLQLDLAPLQRVEGNRVFSAGFGEGLGDVAVGAADIDTRLEAGAATSLRDVDADYLVLVQAAKHAERDPKVKPAEKAKAWAALASYDGKNPLVDEAAAARDRWNAVAEKLDKLKAQYVTDEAKLEVVLRSDDDVVKPAEKEAYKREFAAVYQPRADDLAMAMGSAWVAPDSVGNNGQSASQLGRFRVEVDSGLDVQAINYATEWKDTNGNAFHYYDDRRYQFAGDAGSAGGYAGVTLTLPQIPTPGVGLALRGRYVFGNQVNRVLAGGGVVIVAHPHGSKSGVHVGAFVSFAKLLGVGGSGCGRDGFDAWSSSAACFSQYQMLADGSVGGADFRLSVDYEYLIGDHFQIGVGGDAAGLVLPYSVKLFRRDENTMQLVGDPVAVDGVATGGGATLHATFGIRL